MHKAHKITMAAQVVLAIQSLVLGCAIIAIIFIIIFNENLMHGVVDINKFVGAIAVIIISVSLCFSSWFFARRIILAISLGFLAIALLPLAFYV
tara:strand:- start:204 stop:485 length:282 start_codon:yes stop_codon:yes gene_type:complete